MTFCSAQWNTDRPSWMDDDQRDLHAIILVEEKFTPVGAVAFSQIIMMWLCAGLAHDVRLGPRRLATHRSDEPPLAGLAKDIRRLRTRRAIVPRDESVRRQDRSFGREGSR